jgi:hypothetical protein
MLRVCSYLLTVEVEQGVSDHSKVGENTAGNRMQAGMG